MNRIDIDRIRRKMAESEPSADWPLTWGDLTSLLAVAEDRAATNESEVILRNPAVLGDIRDTEEAEQLLRDELSGDRGLYFAFMLQVAARYYGWSGDYQEVSLFVREIFKLRASGVPWDLLSTPFGERRADGS